MSALPATLAQALAHARAAHALSRAEARMLLLHAIGRASGDSAWLIAHDDLALPADAARRFAALCQRRAAGEPVAYLTGRKAFYGLDLAVDARVLDPRDDTETFVDWALALPLSSLNALVQDAENRRSLSVPLPGNYQNNYPLQHLIDLFESVQALEEHGTEPASAIRAR